MPHYLTWSKPGSRAALEHALLAENIAVTSTDTVLGLLAPLTPLGFAKLDRLKQRSKGAAPSYIKGHANIFA